MIQKEKGDGKMNKLVRNGLEPVPFTKVTIEDHFWAPRIRINREHTIPFQYQKCKETGRIDAFKLDWKPGMEPVPHIFWDSDVAKWIEAASYSLATHPDPGLERLVDEVIDLVASAQQPDGYLNIYFTVVEPEKRWTDLRDAHELYCAGHLIEAGVAHYEATGKRKLLDVVCRYADYIDTVFGPEENKKKGYCGHPEIELALVKLYRVTGEERYLKLSKFFVDERGKEPNYFEEEKKKYGPGYFEELFKTFDNLKEYNQSHKPVREQDKAVGHAVRAMYLYCAMADLAKETGDESLKIACERLWENVHKKNMYITGGIGSTAKHEGFTFDYDLPNETAYAETCAAIGLVFWNHRMLQLDCSGKYADALERALYNGVISGISLDGTKFFYENPLASLGNVHRKEWFDVSCCPPNLARLLASLGQYMYSQNEKEVAVHLYIQGSVNLDVQGKSILLKQKTNYPWDGNILIDLEMEQPSTFALKLRIPGWARQATVKINGEVFDIKQHLEKNYVRIERKWNNHDQVELVFPMPIERVYTNPNVRYNRNCVAIQRGPLVYCLEGADNPEPLYRISLPKNEVLHSHFDEQLLGGVVKITGKAVFYNDFEWDGELYRTSLPAPRQFEFTAIPYYAWDNRKPGQMLVWIPEI